MSTIKRSPYASWKWHTTKAIDAKGHYIRGTDSAGTDYPIAITCHGEKAHAQFLCHAANSHAVLLAACNAALDALHDTPFAATKRMLHCCDYPR